MIIIPLTHPQQKEFLLHVLNTYTQNGIPASELAIAADTFACLENAREIPIEQNLGKATVTEMGPEGVTLAFEGSEQ